MSLVGNGASPGMRSLQQTGARMQRTMQHLATGKRIATASDDAAGLAISKRLEAEVRGLSQGERNLADGVSYAMSAEGSLQSHGDTLGRMRELSIQAQNGTLNDADRATIQQEYDQLSASLDQTAGSASFAGMPQLDGSAAGPGAPQFTDGNGGSVAVDIGAMDATSLGVAARAVGDPSTLAAIDGAIDRVSTTRGSLGSVANQLAYRGNTVATMRLNTDAARSRIEDADFANEVANMTRDRILQGMQVAGLKLHGRASKAGLNLMG